MTVPTKVKVLSIFFSPFVSNFVGRQAFKIDALRSFNHLMKRIENNPTLNMLFWFCTVVGLSNLYLHRPTCTVRENELPIPLLASAAISNICSYAEGLAYGEQRNHAQERRIRPAA